jgi:flagellin
MISGLGISSGIASAVRTAGKARATMDTMSRQIATGQRVASVKDDGAAWTRAAGLRSQQAGVSARRDLVAILTAGSVEQSAEVDKDLATFGQLKDVITRARMHPVGSSHRTALQAEFNGLIAQLDNNAASASTISGAGYGFQADGRWGYQMSPTDPAFGGRTLYVTPGDTAASWTYNAWGGSEWFRDLNLSTASDGYLEFRLGQVEMFAGWARNFASEAGRDQQFLAAVDTRASRESDLLDTAIGTLTDADLGRASTARAQADTRQQLALATVQQALQAYGAYAGGLLGNVQRTQRGIMA